MRMPRRARAPRLRRSLPALALGVLLSTAAHAEALYVIEQLVVNVNSAPDADGERIATVKSGEQVEVIERVRDQVHVRLASGQNGWIRASYLSAEEPLRVRLAQREAELTQLHATVSRLEAELSAPRPGAAAPGAVAVATGAPAAGATAPAAVPPDEASGVLFTAGAPEPPPRRLWPRVLLASLAALLVGFLLGVLALDRHVRRRYGGLRIY
jgi:Bacterial SH3 domain